MPVQNSKQYTSSAQIQYTLHTRVDAKYMTYTISSQLFASHYNLFVIPNRCNQINSSKTIHKTNYKNNPQIISILQRIALLSESNLMHLQPLFKTIKVRKHLVGRCLSTAIVDVSEPLSCVLPLIRLGFTAHFPIHGETLAVAKA